MKIRSSILVAAFMLTGGPVMAALTEMTDIVAISTGGYHSCGITTTGGVKCWGYNGSGALGDGTTFLRYLPVDVVGLDEPVTSISAGYSHTCAVLASDRLKCWGNNQYGKATTDALASIAFASVTAGDHQTCAVTRGSSPPAGTVICWGLTGSGANPEVMFGSGGATAIGIGSDYLVIGAHFAAYYSSTCALVNGGAQCWGHIQEGATTPVAVTGLSSGARSISMNYRDAACAVTTSNAVKCWSGGLTAVDVPGLTSGVASVSVGGEGHRCVLTIDGGAKCWGNNTHGQLGSGVIDQSDMSLRDVPGLTSGVVAVGAGTRHSCALLATGGVRCWGDNFFSQLSNGGPFQSGNPPTAVMTGTLPRLVGISTRAALLTRDDATIAGFIISGPTSKKVVVRAHGPSLASAGVSGVLANPTLQLVRSADQAVIAANDDWELDADATTLQASGFAPHDAKESAIMRTLAPGAYTAIVSGAGGTTGVTIVDVYELEQPETPAIAISTRGQVQTGDNVMIAGFEIEGDVPQTVLIRAIGPSLADHGVIGVLADPMLQLVRMSDKTVIETNDNWGYGPSASLIAQKGLAPANQLESAIYITLQPGQYTAIVSGVGGSNGVGLVEVYAQ